VAFSVSQRGRRLLYVVNADGTGARVVTASMNLRGSPAWTPDGASITSAAEEGGRPRLFRIPLSGTAVPLVDDYSLDPAWSPDGGVLIYSGPDIGTTFRVNAITAAAKPYPIPALSLTRGARRLRFAGHRGLVVMRGALQHQNLWLIDLDSGAERQLTNLPDDFNLRDFDISADGREIVLERVQESSDIVIIDR
jgi:Tol biopolymer transport system component